MNNDEREEWREVLSALDVLMQTKKHELRVVNIACTNCNGHIPCVEGRSDMYDIVTLDEKTIYPKKAIAVEKQLFCTIGCFDEFMLKMKQQRME